jgi:DNA-directed RNA polymerase specialized sigma24 family protein
LYDQLGTVVPDPDGHLVWLDEHYGQSIFAYIRWVTQGRLPLADCQDVYQDAVLVLCERLRQPDLKVRDPLGYWCKLAHDKAMDALRRRRRTLVIDARELLEQSASWFLVGAAESAGTDGGVLESALEIRELTRCSLKVLPPRQRVACEEFLNHFEELGGRDKFERLAVLVGIRTGRHESAATVKSLVYAARRTLAAEMLRARPDLLGGRVP